MTRWILVLTAVLVFGLSLSSAQPPKVLAPHKHALRLLPYTGKWHRPPTLRSMVGGLWMIDANLKSSIYIKNSVAVAPMTVTPVLYLSNGRRYQLKDVKLEPSGVAVVNVNQALAEQGIAPWATLRGYVEIQYKWPWDALCVTVRNVDAVHSLVAAHNLRPATLYSVESGTNAADHLRSYEGVWWKQERNVSGFISLSNSSTRPISARVQVTDSGANIFGTHTVTLSPHGTKIINLTELWSAPTTEGGIHVTYNGPEDGLLLTGELEDESVGFSANLPLSRAPKHSTKEESLSYAALGLMTGEADPMMRFPAGTRFTPYFVARNLADHAVSFQPKVYWVEGSAARSLSLPPVSIPSGVTLNLNLASLISSRMKNFNGNINLAFDFQGHYGDLLMASGSVDQRNTYVFEVSPQATAVSGAKGLSYWSTGNGDDTMVTLWNPADEAQDFTFTVFFSGGHYKYPIHLGPKASRSFNMSEIVEAQTPDAEGNVIPPSVEEGSAEIAGAEGATQPILAAIDVGIYNVQKATCHPVCIDCIGAVDGWIDANPFAVAVGRTIQETFTVQLRNGTQGDLTHSASWKSSNAQVATVSAGLVQGVSTGSLTLSAEEVLVTQNGQICQTYSVPVCQSALVLASSPGNGVPSLDSITPAQGLVGAALPVDIKGSGFVSGATVSAGSNITVSNTKFVSGSELTATFTPSNSLSAGGSQAVTVSNPGTQPSNTKNFFNQIPTKLTFRDYSATKVVLITNGDVLDFYGKIVGSGECGGYRDVQEDLRDQAGSAILGGPFTLTESFSDYSTTVSGLPAPPTQSFKDQNTSVQLLADTQFFGTRAPSCPGANDHESFHQSFVITIGSTQYPLTTVFQWQRGKYTGVFHVDGTTVTQ